MRRALRVAFLRYPHNRRMISFLLMVAMLVSALPITALPAQAAPDGLLSFVQVAAPDINCLFDVDCKITVSDLGSNFTPPAATGNAFLQSRLWPKGEAGTKGAGLYAYLYRIDLRNAVGITAKSCVSQMRINFGPVVSMDYNGDGSVEQAFVVTKGGIGNVKPTSMQQVGSTIIIRFQDPPICVGSSQGNGDSSFFFGFASKLPHQDVKADLTGSLGLSESLDAWAPRLDNGIHVHIGESTNKHFQAGLLLPAVQLVPVQGPNSQEFTHVLLPGVDPNGNPPGFPDVPVVRRLLAVPHGAVARVANVTIGDVESMDNVLLYPSQPSPADAPAAQEGIKPPAGVFDNPPFTMNRQAYASDQKYPAQVVDVTPMGTLRDLDVVQVSIAGGQYDAAKKHLDIFDSVDFDIQFAGGDGGFLPRDESDNPFDKSYDPIYAQALNAAVLQQYPGSVIGARLCWGSEFLIITDHSLRPAADALRTWKVSRGLSTAVFEKGNGAGQIGDSKEKIRDFIRNQFSHCQVRPAYVLLLGDAELIPPFYRVDGYGDDAGTDIDYGLMNNGDILPDLAYGRIPVDTLDQAQTVVDKIIAYEKTPPATPSYYQNMTIASYFQCCRDDVAQAGTDQRNFVETSELVRDGMQSDGYDVQRIYTDDGGTTPNRYYNGTLLPADLRAGSGFPWNGNTSDVISAINNGRFLVLHRDHGWTDGWGSPSFSTSDLAGLSNGALTPVVYSINCASGMFDNETLNPAAQEWPYPSNASDVSWAETLLRMKGGAVSVIGDTRVSPTWANSALTRGLFDATWPDVLPLDGGPTSIQRLGDVLNYGKLYLESQVGVAQTAGSVFQSDADTDMVIYHVLGDPTLLKMWTSNPYRIHFRIYWYELYIPKPGEWVVKYPVEGATLTALQNGNPIARAPIVKGQAVLDFVHDADPSAPIQLSVQHPDGTGALLGGPDTHGLITPKGGVVQDVKSHFELHFDAGAVGDDTDILFDTHAAPTQEAPNGIILVRTFVLDAFDHDSDGQPQPVTHFDKPYTMILGYDDSDLAGASISATGATTPTIDANTLGVQYFDTSDSQWKPVDCSLDTAQKQLTCHADHFTEFALTAKAQQTGGQQLFLPSVSTSK